MHAHSLLSPSSVSRHNVAISLNDAKLFSSDVLKPRVPFLINVKKQKQHAVLAVLNSATFNLPKSKTPALIRTYTDHCEPLVIESSYAYSDPTVHCLHVT